MSWLITPQQKIDPDAAVYLSRVEAADGQALEAGVRTAVDQFVLGCKADGIWSAINASCILAGARTVTGALVPLAGTAPTNVGPFVSGDYDRNTGLLGGGAKYIDSNRANNSDPQNSKHLSVYVTTSPTFNSNKGLFGSDGTTTNGVSHLLVVNNNTLWARANSNGGIDQAAPNIGLWSVSRSGPNTLTARYSGVVYSSSASSQTPTSSTLKLFGGWGGYSATNARLAFYSIGESLNLALLDARVTTLVNAIDAAIPDI